MIISAHIFESYLKYPFKCWLLCLGEKGELNVYLDFIQMRDNFTLFNLCRKQAEKKTAYPNTPFVMFHLEGMLASINRLHDRVNAIVKLLLFETRIKHLRDTKEINLRQYAILTQVVERGKPLQIDELRRAPWHDESGLDN